MMVFSLGAETAMGQSKTQFEISTGLIIPTGKELSEAYAAGMRLEMGPRFQVGSFYVTPQVSSDFYVNNPGGSSSKINDNLLLYGVRVHVGYKLPVGNFFIEPTVGVGIGKGLNFVTSGNSDFTGGYFKEWGKVMTLNTFNYDIGAIGSITSRIYVGIRYTFCPASVELTDEAKNNVPFSYISTQLYGSVVDFPEQKMKLDNFSIQLLLRL
jgi:hypothetical protein